MDETEILLNRFKSEVINRGWDSALPGNLSDEWLQILLNITDRILDQDEHDFLSTAMLAVVHILMAKEGITDRLALDAEELFDYISYYRIELNLELVNRRTEITTSSATLENIFTNREVTAERHSWDSE